MEHEFRYGTAESTTSTMEKRSRALQQRIQPKRDRVCIEVATRISLKEVFHEK